MRWLMVVVLLVAGCSDWQPVATKTWCSGAAYGGQTMPPECNP